MAEIVSAFGWVGICIMVFAVMLFIAPLMIWSTSREILGRMTDTADAYLAVLEELKKSTTALNTILLIEKRTHLDQRLTIECSACHHQLSLPFEFSGPTTCPRCKAEIEVPV